MLLPCPHCRRQFRIHAEQIGSHRAKVKCPACNGLFVLDLTPEDRSEPMDSRLRGNDDQVRNGLPRSTDEHSADDHGLSGTAAHVGELPVFHPAQARIQRQRPRFLMLWTLVPACCLFLALTAIFLSGPWRSTKDFGEHASLSATGNEAPLSSSFSSQPERSGDARAPNHSADSADLAAGLETNDPVAHAFWASASPDAEDPCEELLSKQQELLEEEGEDPCRIYPLWITYLVLRTASTPECELEPTFHRATGAMQKDALCGPGYAFLSTYYLDKRVIERSQALHEEALGLEPENPWVRLVEALLHERAYYDDQKAIEILEGLTGQHPSFSLAHYLLARAYIREEDYGKADGSFETLREDVRGQVAFWRIRRALSVLEKAPDQSVDKAEGLLAMSRAFTVLNDYPMAEHLYRRVLEEMPERLPTRERMTAYCELGRICETRGDSSSAYDAYRSALEIDPDFPAARKGISGLLAHQSNPS